MKKILSILTSAAITALPTIVFAATPENPGTYGWPAIVAFLKGTIYTIGGVIVVVALLISGILFVTASGDADKIKTARSALVWAVAGAVVIIIAASVWTIITGWI